MKNKILQICKFLFFVALGFFIIWLFQRQLTPDEKVKILDSFYEANYFYVFLSLSVTILAFFIRALLWRMLLQSLGYQPRINKIFGAVIVGYFANLAFPRFGEIFKCVILNRYDGIPTQKSLGTVIVERALDMIVLGTIFLLVLLMQFDLIKDFLYTRFGSEIQAKFGNTSLIFMFFGILLAIMLLIVLLYFLFRKKLSQSKFYQKIVALVHDFYSGLKSIAKVKHPILFIVCAVSIWVLYIISFYLIFKSMDATSGVSVKNMLAVFAIASIGMMITPGGIGLYPVLVAEGLATFGVLKASGYALGWIAWTTQTATIIIMGLLYMTLFPVFYKRKS